jgi:hypothetical protein
MVGAEDFWLKNIKKYLTRPKLYSRFAATWIQTIQNVVRADLLAAILL